MARKTKEQQINELKEQVARLEELLRKNCALFDEFRDRVLRGEFRSRWLPVTEFLPEEGRFLFARLDDDTFIVAKYADGKFDLGGDETTASVTHWFYAPFFAEQTEETESEDEME